MLCIHTDMRIHEREPHNGAGRCLYLRGEAVAAPIEKASAKTF
jgi:hypothetical protein